MTALTTAWGRVRPAFAALALGLTFAVAAPATAQFGLQSGFQDAFRPGFTGRDVQIAVDMLKLDGSQKYILETLYEDYQEEFRAGVNGFRQSITDMRTTLGDDPANASPQDIMRVVFGAMEEWRTEAAGLVTQFTEDLRGLLNLEQMALWPSFERRLFRMKYLGNGRLSGENLDLTTAVREMNLTPGQIADLKTLMDEYEVRLDAAIRDRENFVNSTQGDLLQAIQNDDPTIGIEVAQRQVQLRKAVRDVNESYATRIAESIGGETGQAFLKSIMERTYARVFRVTSEQRIFAAATKIDDLDADLLAAIESLEIQFLTELAVLNDRLVSIIRSHEPAKLQNKVEMAASRMAGTTRSSLEDPTKLEYQARRDMGRRYVEQLKALLAPEQFAALPGAGRYAEPGEIQRLLGPGARKIAGFQTGKRGKPRSGPPPEDN